MGLPLSAAAGAAGDSLYDQLQDAFKQSILRQQQQAEQQRIAIEQQNANTNEAYRQMYGQAMQDQKAALAHEQTARAGVDLQNALGPNADITNNPQAVKILGEAGLPTQTTAAQPLKVTGVGAPMGIPLISPPTPQKIVSTGNAAQIQAEADRAQARQDKIDAADRAAVDRQDLAKLTASLRPAPPPHFSVQSVPDPNNPGQTMLVRVDTAAGDVTPLTMGGQNVAGKSSINATTANRLESAKAVVQTGNDILQTLKDPKVAAALGPIMSRYNSVADFVGNAPPEWSKLAGQIESFSLANMGVHGMRSASGAEAIKNTLGQGRHTPESMAAALEGLNGFSNHLLQNNGQTVPGVAAPSAGGGRIRVKGPNGESGTVPEGTALPAGWSKVGG